MPTPRRLLILNSREDEDDLKLLLPHFAHAERQQELVLLLRSRVLAGEDMHAWLDAATAEADAVLLVLTPSFLADDHIHHLLARLLARSDADGLLLLPLPFRPCLWRDVP